MTDDDSNLRGLGRNGAPRHNEQGDAGDAQKGGVGKIAKPSNQAGGEGPIVVTSSGDGFHKLLIAGAVMALVIGGIIGAVLVFGRASDPRISRPQIQTGAKIGLDAEQEIRAFTRSTSQQMAEAQQLMTQLQQQLTDQNRRLDQTEQRNKELMKEAVAAFTAASGEKLRAIESALEEQRRLASSVEMHASSPRDASAQTILKNLQAELSGGKLTKLEATERAATALRSAGYKEQDIRNMLAESKTQAGVIAVGDIAEPPPTQAELAAVNPALRAYIVDARNYVGGIAALDRIIDEATVKAKLSLFLQSKTNGAKISEAELQAFYVVTRVRRENLPDAFAERIPSLVKQRDLLGLKSTDWRGIADMIWQNRSMFGEVLPPGQLLSLVQIVSRQVGAVSSEAVSTTAQNFSPISDIQIGILGQVVDQALDNNWSLGSRDEGALIVSASKVVASFLENSRTTMEDGRRVDFIGSRVASYVTRKRGGGNGGGTAPSSFGNPPPALVNNKPSAATPVQEPKIETGGLSLSRSRLQSTIYLMTPGILAAANIKPGSDEAMASTIVLWEQNRRLTDLAFTEAASARDGVGIATQILVPNMIELAKAGAGLTAVKIGHADQHADREMHTVLIAYLASQVGPVIHDYQSAGKKVNEVDVALRSTTPPDLTQARKALLSARDAVKVEKK